MVKRDPGHQDRRFDPLREARAVQRLAASPDVSVVLKAGAGSGKTHTLVDRFVRLCVEAPAVLRTGGGDGNWPGIHPRSIVAITFTRKAAVEIKGRLLQRALGLALEGEAEVREDLREMFGRDPSAAEVRRAATLYERVLEYPQGLKIGTIHHFCQLILGRFAVEAGLDPGYGVVEDTSELRDEALDILEQQAADDPETAALADRVGSDPQTLRMTLQQSFNARMQLERWRVRVLRDAPEARTSLTACSDAMVADLAAHVFADAGRGGPASWVEAARNLAAALREFAGPGMDAVLADLDGDYLTDNARTKPRASALEAAEACDAVVERLETAAPEDRAKMVKDAAALAETARKVFLTGKDEPRVWARGPKHADRKLLYNEMVFAAAGGVLAAARILILRDLLEVNAALLRLVMLAFAIYDGLKRRDRVVDFQDLEELARRLMGDGSRAVELLYRLDDSITHLMVDEFQDTNLNQDEILRPLLEEFLGGGSGQTDWPTVFFVGDAKQSIYRFRGAEPELFGRLWDEFASRAAEPDPLVGPGVRVLVLPTNFRSLPAVTEGVGDLFLQPPLAGLLGVGKDTDPEKELRQLCARSGPREGLPDEGAVWVVPPFSAADQDEQDEDQRAARAAARLVKELRAHGVTVDRDRPGRTRPLVWSDFLVLMRTRTRAGLYEEAFRRQDIPLTPSGRGTLASTREVQDITALLQWLVWPEDDIALATVLRGPLFRLEAAEFQGLLSSRGLDRLRPDGEGFAAPRGLWRALQDAPEDSPAGRAARMLSRWRSRAGYEHCHDLLRRIYREADVPTRYRLALGEQAVFNLERLFDLALGRELASEPTVRGLLRLLERARRAGGEDVGVAPGAGGEGRVRFMTIHGAKGLEAPVVLYVDADHESGREDVRVVLGGGGDCPALLLKTDSRQRDTALSDPVARAVESARRKLRTEGANLDYVAMTRARDRLYILGGDKSNGNPDYSSPLRRILAAAAAAVACNGDDVVRVGMPPELESFAPEEESLPDRNGSGPGPEDSVALGARVWSPPSLGPVVRIIRPSGHGDAGQAGQSVSPGGRPGGGSRSGDEHPEPGDLPGMTAPGGREHGLRVHALLEAAARLGAMPPGDGPAWEEARSVFTDPDLAWIFRPANDGDRGLSEVPVIAERPARAGGGIPERITGVIDRLILREGRVDIVDFKTDRCAGDADRRAQIAAHYRPQLALYAEVLAGAYPGREIRTWLLLTDPGLGSGDRLLEITGI